jgi:hypothetical protein
LTEQEWQSCADPLPMLAFLRDRGSERKLRLLAVACCRQIWERITDERSRRAVEVAELFADGAARDDDLVRASHAAYDASMAAAATGGIVWGAASAAASSSHPEIRRRIGGDGGAVGMSLYRAKAKRRAQVCGLIRCIFGTLPFRPPNIAANCLTPALNDFAWSMYEERTFGRMPELGEALANAGCSDADILAHCREPGEHARGCWVLDLLLEKA